MRPGDKIVLRMELFPQFFHKEKRIILRVLLDLIETEMAYLNIYVGEKLAYEYYAVSSTTAVDVGFCEGELRVFGDKEEEVNRVEMDNGQKKIMVGDVDMTAREDTEHMAAITFVHMGDNYLLIRRIGAMLSQSVEPFQGIFARIASTEDPEAEENSDDEDEERKIFADLGGDIVPQMEIIDSYRDPEEPIKYSPVDGSNFVKIEVDATQYLDMKRDALCLSKKGKPIKIKVYFYVMTEVLNLRASGDFYIRLLVTHFGPDVPHVRFRLNGKLD